MAAEEKFHGFERESERECEGKKFSPFQLLHMFRMCDVRMYIVV